MLLKQNPTDYSQYGITISGNSIKLDRTNSKKGSRGYITAAPNGNK